MVSNKQRLKAVGSHLHSPTLFLLVTLATIGAVLYFQFLIRPENRGDLIPYIIVIAAESFIILHALVTMWTILAGTHDPRNFEFHDAQSHLFTDNADCKRYDEINSDSEVARQQELYLHGRPVSVDVFVTVYGESLEDIRLTATAARDIVGKHGTYILDDGQSDDVKDLADDLNVKYIRRGNATGAKAGNINNALGLTNADYFVIFDADFIAERNFLYETLPFFEDPNVAFVQTPQHYTNLKTIISRGAGYTQRLFYKLIQPGKNRFNAAFCVGTNVVFNRKAIDSIGGIYEKSKSEDIWTSILLHEKGYRSIFIPEVLATGKTPDTIKAYTKQQLRWATGGFQILFHHNPLTKKLTLDQKVQYFHSATHYLHGLAVLLLVMLPPIHIYFDLTPVTIHVNFLIWLIFYLLFYALQVMIAFYTMGGFRMETIMLAMASFPIYVQALFQGLRKKEESWHATGNKRRVDSPFNYIQPQVLLWIFLVITSAVGIWKTYYYETLSLAVFWCVLDSLLLGSFLLIARREHVRLKRAARREARQARRERRRKALVPINVVSEYERSS